MKRMIALLLIVIMLIFLAACSSKKEAHESFTETGLKECGFTVESFLGNMGDKYFYLIHDNDTNIKYIYVDDYMGVALCPYYDETGNVAIYDGD